MSLKEDNRSQDRHRKHTTLIRPVLGNFGRNEWAIVGAPCSEIKALAEKLIEALSPQANVAYVDAQHNEEATVASGRISAGAAMEYTQKGGGPQLEINGTLNHFQNRVLFNNYDILLLNGNHHPGQQQVVVIDSNKKASLQKRISELTKIKLFLLKDGEAEIFDFIKNAIPDWQQIPTLQFNNEDKIVQFLKDELAQTQPELYGLVLAGGKSERMGQDKGAINWHQKEQRYHMADLLKNYTKHVYISCRAEQQQAIDPTYQTLPDTFTGLGPFGAIVSAFREQPEKAWLVVACDLPLLDKATLDFLTAHRDTSAIATTFESPDSGFPEPLITIWEPKSYGVLLSFLAQGYSCPRKVLINSDTRIWQAPDTNALTNVNTPAEQERVKAILQQKDLTV